MGFVFVCFFGGGGGVEVFKEQTDLIIWNNQDYKNRFKACGIHILGIPEMSNINK